MVFLHLFESMHESGFSILNGDDETFHSVKLSAYVVLSVHTSSLIVYTFFSLSQFVRTPDDSSNVLNIAQEKASSLILRPQIMSSHKST